MEKPKSVQKWGLDTAKERYGSVGKTVAPCVEHQAPQAPEDKHGSSYDNDTPSNWLRGMGKDHAEGKPSFNKGKSG